MNIFYLIEEANSSSPDYGTYTLQAEANTIINFNHEPTQQEVDKAIDEWWNSGRTSYRVWLGKWDVQFININKNDITELIVENSKDYDKKGNFKKWSKKYYLKNKRKIT